MARFSLSRNLCWCWCLPLLGSRADSQDEKNKISFIKQLRKLVAVASPALPVGCHRCHQDISLQQPPHWTRTELTHTHSWLPTHPSHQALPSFGRRLATCSAKGTGTQTTAYQWADRGITHLPCSCRSHLLHPKSPMTPGEPLPLLQGKPKPVRELLGSSQVWRWCKKAETFC